MELFSRRARIMRHPLPSERGGAPLLLWCVRGIDIGALRLHLRTSLERYSAAPLRMYIVACPGYSGITTITADVTGVIVAVASDAVVTATHAATVASATAVTTTTVTTIITGAIAAIAAAVAAIIGPGAITTVRVAAGAVVTSTGILTAITTVAANAGGIAFIGGVTPPGLAWITAAAPVSARALTYTGSISPLVAHTIPPTFSTNIAVTATARGGLAAGRKGEPWLRYAPQLTRVAVAATASCAMAGGQVCLCVCVGDVAGGGCSGVARSPCAARVEGRRQQRAGGGGMAGAEAATRDWARKGERPYRATHCG